MVSRPRQFTSVRPLLRHEPPPDPREIQRRRDEARYALLCSAYEGTGNGRADREMDWMGLCVQIRWVEREHRDDALEYLLSEGLLVEVQMQGYTSTYYRLTSAGRNEYEATLRGRRAATARFPATVIREVHRRIGGRSASRWMSPLKWLGRCAAECFTRIEWLLAKAATVSKLCAILLVAWRASAGWFGGK